MRLLLVDTRMLGNNVGQGMVAKSALLLVEQEYLKLMIPFVKVVPGKGVQHEHARALIVFICA